MNLHPLTGVCRNYFTFGPTLTMAILLCAASIAHAQQYRWLDEKGRVQYTDTPPPPHAKGVEKKILRSGQAPEGQEPFALQTARKNSPVRLFSMPECGSSCEDARKLLLQRGIPFNETVVTKVEQIEELKRLSGSSVVPVMLVGSRVEKGFEAESFHRTLDDAGYPRASALRPVVPSAPPSKATTTTGTAATPSTPPAPAASGPSKAATK